MAEPSLARLREWFDAVIDLPEAERAGRLEVLQVPPEVAARVLRMASDCGDGQSSQATLLRQRLSELNLAASEPPEVEAGDVLGVWRLQAEIGRGGMGRVYLVERVDGHFQQQGALKLLQGRPSAAALALLAGERQILARLTHPNIARLLDGGATPRGRPYLVMEHVAGVQLDQYLRQHALSVEQRVRLFTRICAPVAFAHAQLVIHCDLKPSNVLVTDEGRPVLLDFGIARLLESGGSEVAISSKAYTPGFASPELQAGEAVSAATDVYSLGILLREMLGSDGRHADLRAIIARATRDDPAQRYESVTLLAQDVQRFLDRRPVQASQGGWSYRGGKLLQRRWPAVTAVVAFLSLIAVFSWRVVSERDRALAALQRADQEAATALASNEFLQSVFAGADVEKRGSRELTALEVVDAGWERIATELSEQPATQASLYGALANVYMNLGRPERAADGFARAIAIERTMQPPRPLQLALQLRNAAVQASASSRFAEAEALAREALALARAHAPPISRDVGNAATAVALSLRDGGYAEAEALLLEHLEIRRALGEPEIDLASTWHNLGLTASRADQRDKALDYFGEALRIKREVLGEQHARTLATLEVLAAEHLRARRLEQARELLLQALEGRQQVNGETSSHTLRDLGELAYVDGDLGRHLDCIAGYDSLLASLRQLGRSDSAEYARYLNNQAFCLDGAGLQQRAIEALRQSLALRLRHYAADDPAVARVEGSLGRHLSEAGQLAEAEALLLRSLATRQARFPPEHRELLGVELSLVGWSLLSGELDAASQRLQAVLPRLPTEVTREVLAAALWQARLAQRRGQVESARQALDHYLSLQSDFLSVGHPLLLWAQLEALEVRAGLGESVADPAAALCQQIYRREEAFPPDSSLHARCRALR